MKRIASTLLALAIVISCTIGAFAASPKIGGHHNIPEIQYDYTGELFTMQDMAACVLYSYGLFEGAGQDETGHLIFNLDNSVKVNTGPAQSKEDATTKPCQT